MVAYLEKSEGSEGFHQIIDFLTASHIKNALTECPTLYASPIEQFWQTVALSTNEDGVRGITDTIDRKVKVFFSEASIRRHLKLEDSEGLKTLPIAEIFEQLALMGLSLHELTNLCTSLSKKVASLESELKQTKQTYNAALTKLINRGRSLIEELDLDAEISLVLTHAADQGRIDDTQFSNQPKEQLGVFSAATALTGYAARRRQFVFYLCLEKNFQLTPEEEAEVVEQWLSYILRQTRQEKGLTLKQSWNYKSSDMEEKKLQLKVDQASSEQAVKESSRTARGRRNKSLARKRAKETLSEESAKKQKLEDDNEKEELQVYLSIVPEEESLNIESLATKQDVLELADWSRIDFRQQVQEGL
ncbi:hypothetical protein Tco_0175449 [Tanacetum coccineum]